MIFIFVMPVCQYFYFCNPGDAGDYISIAKGFPDIFA